MMNCLQITRSVGDFLEQKLKFRDRMAFLLHIAMCRGCRAYLEQVRLSILGLRSLKQPTAAGPQVETLLNWFREEIKHRDR